MISTNQSTNRSIYALIGSSEVKNAMRTWCILLIPFTTKKQTKGRRTGRIPLAVNHDKHLSRRFQIYRGNRIVYITPDRYNAEHMSRFQLLLSTNQRRQFCIINKLSFSLRFEQEYKRGKISFTLSCFFYNYKKKSVFQQQQSIYSFTYLLLSILMLEIHPPHPHKNKNYFVLPQRKKQVTTLGLPPGKQ